MAEGDPEYDARREPLVDRRSSSDSELSSSSSLGVFRAVLRPSDGLTGGASSFPKYQLDWTVEFLAVRVPSAVRFSGGSLGMSGWDGEKKDWRLFREPEREALVSRGGLAVIGVVGPDPRRGGIMGGMGSCIGCRGLIIVPAGAKGL